jgi:flagellar hook-associated protein FlgK
VKTTSSGSVGGLIDVRSLSGKLNASNRAFDIANAGNDGAEIKLSADGDVNLTVTAGQGLPVATTRANKSKNQLIQVRSAGAGVLVGSQAQVLSPLGGKGASGNANLLTSCTGVTKQGTVDVPDLNLADDSGVCSAPPQPIFTDCSQFGITF